MTVKRHQKDEGDDEMMELKWGGKTITYRTLIFAGLLSLTPFGDWMFAKMGIIRPAQDAAQRISEQIERRLSSLEIGQAHARGEMDALIAQVERISKRNQNTKTQ